MFFRRLSFLITQVFSQLKTSSHNRNVEQP